MLSVSFTYEGREYIAQTVDVSKTGALFRAAIIPDLDTKLLFNLADKNNPQLSLYLKAAVVRYQEGEGNEALFAVRFGDAVARDPRRLRRFLDSVLGIGTGLIRVVEEEGGAKAYAFSFEPVLKEGEERLKALQALLFTTYDELEEADSILANFGKGISGAEVERHLDSKTEKKKKRGWFRRKEDRRKEDRRKEDRIEEPASEVEEQVVPIPEVVPQPQQEVLTAPVAAQAPASLEEDVPISVFEDTPDAVDAKRAAALAQMQQMLDEGYSDTMPLPDDMAGEMRAGRPPSLDQLLAAGSSFQDSSAEQVELPLTAEALGSDLGGDEDEALPVQDDYVPASEEALPPPDVGLKKGGFLGRLGSMFAGGKQGAKGEKLINPQPLPNLVARDTSLSVVYRMGSSRFQGKAVRLYCAGLKLETNEQLPSLYQSLTLLIPLAGAKRISQIELAGDVTRVRPNVANSDSAGIFEVRFSMRSDKIHLELYRALLEKLTGGNP